MFESLNTILETKKEASMAFKKGGGFTCVLSIAKCLRGCQCTECSAAAVSKFLVSAARVLQAALKGSPESSDFIKEKSFFQALTSTLKICFENCQEKDLGELIDIVISMSVQGSWPPPSAHKGCSVEERTLCSECTSSMTLEVPEIIRILLIDLQAIIATKSTAAQLQVLEKVRTLVTFTPDNLEALNSAGVHSTMISTLGEQLTQYAVNGNNNSNERSEDRAVALLLDILMKVLAQNVTGRNVRRLFRELWRTGYSPRVTALLQRLADVPQSPSSSLLLSTKSGIVGLESKVLRSRPWPPRQFTASMWICVKSYGQGGEYLELFSFQSQFQSQVRLGELKASLTPQGTLRFQTSFPSSSSSSLPLMPAGASEGSIGAEMCLQGSVTFAKTHITENVWHHIVIGYKTPNQSPQQMYQEQLAYYKQQQQQQQQQVKITDPRTCTVDLYLDGDFAETATVSLGFPEDTSIKFVVGFAAQRETTPSGSVKVSSMYFFDAAPTSMDVLVMHSLKSGSWGNMRWDFTSMEHCISAAGGPPSEDVKRLLLRPRSVSLERLAQCLILAFVPRKMHIVDSDLLSPGKSVLFHTADGAVVDPERLLPMFLAAAVKSSRNIREVLSEVGGIQVVLYMAGTAATREQQRSAFRLLVSLLADSPANCQQMRAVNGYKLLSRIMSKPSWALDRETLDLTFELVGVARSSQESWAYDKGIVLDTDALQCLVLDWHIWARAPDALKEDLFQGLSSLITVNNASGFNLLRLTQCNIVTELMHIIQRTDTSLRIVHAVISLIKEVIDAGSVCKNDVQAIANFLFATHKVEQQQQQQPQSPTKNVYITQQAHQQQEQEEEEKKKIAQPAQTTNDMPIHFPLLTTGVIGGTLSPQRSRSKSVSVPKSSGLRNQVLSFNKRMSEAEETEANGKTVYMKKDKKKRMRRRKRSGDDALIQKRVLVLEMLHGILSRVNYAAKEIFVEAFPLEVTLAMLQHSTLALRVPLLILLGLCLQNDTQAGKKKSKTQGVMRGIASIVSSSVMPKNEKSLMRMSHETAALMMSSPAIPSTISATASNASNSSAGSNNGNSRNSKSLYLRFVALGGFDLLGMQLQSYSASAELYHTLFRLLVGNNFPKEFKAETNISGNGLSLAVAEAEAALYSGSDSGSGCGNGGNGSGGSSSGGGGGSSSGGSGGLAASKLSGGSGSEGGEFTLARPEVLKTILRIAAGPHAEYKEQHSVIRGLHQICTISEGSMQELIENGLVMGLYGILRARMKARQARTEEKEKERNRDPAFPGETGRVRSGSFGSALDGRRSVLSMFHSFLKAEGADNEPLAPVSTEEEDREEECNSSGSKSGNESEEDDESTEDDEDIMLFMKTIALNSTSEMDTAKNFSGILLCLRSAGFCVEATKVLQERILCDAFRVFTENPGFYSSPCLVAKFAWLAEVALEFIRWDISEDSSSSTTNSNSSSSSVPGREHLRVSGVKQDKAAGMVLILLVNILNKTSPGSQALKEKIGKLLTKVADLTWRLLLYVLRSDKRPSELCAIALSAVGEEYLLTTCPQVGRTYAVMFHATRFYVVPALEDAARNAVKEILRLGPRPNTLLLALMPGHFRLDAEAAEKVCMTVKNVFQLPEECEETLKLHRTVVEEAIGWALQEDRRAREFQAAQEGAIQAASRSQEALRATIAEKCLFIAETARKVQKSAEDRPMLEVSRQRQADAGATHAAWKAIFNGVTHERAVFALDIHGPFHRLGLDPTEDGQRQRLRLRWETSDPPEATLNPPFSALDITNQQWGVPGTLVVQHVSDREYYRIDTYGFCGAGGDSNSSGNDSEKNTSLPTDKYPIVNAVEPLWEDGTAGGHVVRICGTEIHPDDPKLTVYIGGVICDIVGGREDSEVDVRSPPQRVPGFYGVIVAYDGYFRRSSNRYGYLEVSLFKQYLSAKNAIPLDPDKPVPPVPITCGLPKKLAPNPIATTEPEEKCLPATATAGIAPTTTATSLPVRCDEDDDDPATATPAADGESEEENEGEGEGDESGPVVFKERYAVVLDCTWITAFSERPGKVCMNKVGLAFFAEGSVVGVLRKYSWRFEDICEIYGRRHMLRNVAIELFFTTGKTCLFAFADCATRDRFWGIVCKANLPNLLPCDTVEDLRGGLLTNSLTDRWAFGQISNYEYLMRLNVLAGRTFNDLNQYPVFPWVLADYTSEKLDLNDPKSFRDLSKPMGAQNPSRAEKFVAKYEQLAELGETPYHYGTHYSSSGAVLHYMLRLEPYASYHVAFQSGRFDVPDRLFYDMSVAWRLSSGAGLGDVKELIPEFFTLPEMFENRNNFDFGERQDGSRVYGVRLPPWAHNDPREFVRIHRAALESEYVSAHLHEWIDLIFGCKQQSKEALNVFHPYTCEGGIDWDAIKDPVDRLAKQTQVNTWGQTPRKLFSKPHPPRNLRALRQLAASVPVYTAPFAAHFVTRIKLPVSEITLENGVPTFYGAHRLPVHKRSSATVNASQQQQHRKTANSDNNNNISVSSIDVSSTESSSSSSSSSTANTSVNTSASSNTGAMGSDSVTAVSLGDEVVGVPASTPGGTSNGNSATSRVHPKESNIREVYATTVVLGNSGGYESTSNNSYGSSGTNDEFISWGHWDNSMRLVLNDPKVIVVNTCDTITAAATSSTGHCVVCGSAGGTVTAWKRRDPLTPALLGFPTRLHGHTGPVTAVFVSSEYNIIVSGSKDATCIVWDINKMGYVRTLRHNHPIVAVCVSPVTGYIYTIERPNDSESTTLSLWSVNGDQIVYTSTPGANCVQVTANTPGVKSNFVAVGNMNGTITLLTANNLNRVTTFMRDSASTSFIPLSPITAITFS